MQVQNKSGEQIYQKEQKEKMVKIISSLFKVTVARAQKIGLKSTYLKI